MCVSRNDTNNNYYLDVPETSKVAVKVKIENKTSYRCIECDNTYPRRFNAERHYKRFHEVTQARRCCGKYISIIYYSAYTSNVLKIFFFSVAH